MNITVYFLQVNITFSCPVLLVISLLYTTTANVYYVVPENHTTTQNNTYTLRHYLDNVNKYFVSNTVLHFLPGQFFLATPILIRGVHNFSFTGSRTNEVISSVINCTRPAGIAVVSSSNLGVANIVMNECGSNYSTLLNSYLVKDGYVNLASLLILDSQSVTCSYLYSYCNQPSGFKLINSFGNTSITNTVSHYIMIRHHNSNKLMTNRIHRLHIEEFQADRQSIDYLYAITIKQSSVFDVNITVANVKFKNTLALYITNTECSGNLILTIVSCIFINNAYKSANEMINSYFDVIRKYHYNETESFDIIEFMKTTNYIDTSLYFDSMVYSYYKKCEKSSRNDRIQFINSCFISNCWPKELLSFTQSYYKTEHTSYLSIFIISCIFHENQNITILRTRYYSDNYALILMKHTSLSNNIQRTNAIIQIQGTQLKLYSTVLSSNVVLYNQYGSIIEALNSYIEFENYNDISKNFAYFGITSNMVIHIQENTTVNLTSNNFYFLIYISSHNDFKMCPFQYTSKRGNLDKWFQMGTHLQYSITFYHNSIVDIANSNLLHCSWDSTSALVTSRPLQVNQRFIHYEQSLYPESNKSICLCKSDQPYNCQKDEMGPIYPGQKVTFNFALFNRRTKLALITNMEGSNFTCKSDKATIRTLTTRCNQVEYTVKHGSGLWCDLYLKVQPLDYTSNIYWMEMFTIVMAPCPKGFKLYLDGSCQCDPILSLHIPSLTTCDIDHQTIPRPANAWISAHTINDSHSYHVSLHCPFDYCLPHSSQLNLSTPDSQCQFNRSGLLCGQCQHDLSTVFGSSRCRHCTNSYILLILFSIGITGVLLVLCLFILNLTVTNGSINAFLFYSNVIGINASVLFPMNRSVAYTLILLANLDLGIETCFYKSMDDYAKMWLQLLFPVYLIFIAISLIVTSRYFATIQRLTARRALPVLATLFLLSYTKVLLTVSNVLFSYSRIIHLPSNHTFLMWSVDANVTLFGIKFFILFATCLILFLILIPFNVILLFTRKLSCFKCVNHFKPLLDAYQGPYKITFYYWTGLQLLLRAIFVGLSALDQNTNIMISITLLGIMIWTHNKLSPYKCNMNNTIEALSLLNLLTIFAVSQNTNAKDAIVTILVSLAIFQMVCIVLVKTISLLCNTFFKNIATFDYTKIKIWLFFNNFRKADEENHIQLVNTAPEVTYNYNEFQDSLIGQD